MTQTIDFIFDFASPNAYLAYKALPEITSIPIGEVNIIPCLLGGIFKTTGNQAPFISFANVKGKVDYEMLEFRRFIAKHQLTKFIMNPHFPVNTLLPMRGLIVAQEAGDGQRYIEVMLKAIWEDGKNIGDETVMLEILSDTGFDGKNILTHIKGADIKTALIGNTNDAVARGAFGVPTFFVGDEMFFGKDRLDQVSAVINGSM